MVELAGFELDAIEFDANDSFALRADLYFEANDSFALRAGLELEANNSFALRAGLAFNRLLRRSPGSSSSIARVLPLDPWGDDQYSPSSDES